MASPSPLSSTTPPVTLSELGLGAWGDAAPTFALLTSPSSVGGRPSAVMLIPPSAPPAVSEVALTEPPDLASASRRSSASAGGSSAGGAGLSRPASSLAAPSAAEPLPPTLLDALITHALSLPVEVIVKHVLAPLVRGSHE